MNAPTVRTAPESPGGPATAPGAPDPARIAEATGLHQQGHLAEAIARYRALLAQYPALPAIWMLLGMAQLQTGQMRDAAAALEQSLRLNPTNALAWANLGNAQQALGDPATAVASFERALTLAPDHLDALFNRGVSLDALARVDEALKSYRAVLARAPAHPGALNNAGEALRKLGHLAEARAIFDTAITAYPERADLRLNRGTAAFEAGDAVAALVDFEALLALVPDHPVGLNNCGNVLHALGRHAQALDRFDRALAVQPTYAQAWLNRANALQALMRLDDAQASYARALEVAPDSSEARWNASHLALLRGRFESGWRDYEARWQLGARFDAPRHTGTPVWRRGVDIRGKRIMLWHEQGLGDTLQFCRYAPLVAALGAQPVLEVQPPLKTLISASMPGIEVIATGEPAAACDYALPLMSLPWILGTDETSVPAPSSYLHASEADIERWSHALGPRTGKPRVGIAFSGNARHNNDANRSIAAAEMVALAAVAELVVIQKDIRPDDARVLAAHPSIRCLGAQLGDFSDTAALVAALDLVITVDTSLAHLAGALGKPVWIVLPALPDWRWQLERDDSPWYPQARLVRRGAGELATRVIQTLAGDLSEHARQP